MATVDAVSANQYITGKYYLVEVRSDSDENYVKQACILFGGESNENEDPATADLYICKVLKGPFDCPCEKAESPEGCQPCECENDEIELWEPVVSAQSEDGYLAGACVLWQDVVCDSYATQAMAEQQQQFIKNDSSIPKTTLYKRTSEDFGGGANDSKWTAPCVANNPLWEKIQRCTTTTTTTTTTTSDCETCLQHWQGGPTGDVPASCSIIGGTLTSQAVGSCNLRYDHIQIKIIDCATGSPPSWAVGRGSEPGWADVSYGAMSSEFQLFFKNGAQGGIDYGRFQNELVGKIYKFNYTSSRITNPTGGLIATTDEEWDKFVGPEECGSGCYEIRSVRKNATTAQKTIICSAELDLKGGGRTGKQRGYGSCIECNVATTTTTTTTSCAEDGGQYWLKITVCSTSGDPQFQTAYVSVSKEGILLYGKNAGTKLNSSIGFSTIGDAVTQQGGPGYLKGHFCENGIRCFQAWQIVTTKPSEDIIDTLEHIEATEKSNEPNIGYIWPNCKCSLCDKCQIQDGTPITCETLLSQENIAKLQIGGSVPQITPIPAAGLWKAGKIYKQGDCVIALHCSDCSPTINGQQLPRGRYLGLYECTYTATAQNPPPHPGANEPPSKQTRTFNLCKLCKQEAVTTTTCDPQLANKTGSDCACDKEIIIDPGPPIVTKDTGIIEEYNNPIAPPICPGQCITRTDRKAQWMNPETGKFEVRKHKYIYLPQGNILTGSTARVITAIPVPTQSKGAGYSVWEWAGVCPTTSTTTTTTTTTSTTPCPCDGTPVWNPAGKSYDPVTKQWTPWAKDDCAIFLRPSSGAGNYEDGVLKPMGRVYKTSVNHSVCGGGREPGSQGSSWTVQRDTSAPIAPGQTSPYIDCDFCEECGCDSTPTTWESIIAANPDPKNWPFIMPGTCISYKNRRFYLRKFYCGMASHPQGYRAPPEPGAGDTRSDFWSKCLDCETTTTTTTTPSCEGCEVCEDALNGSAFGQGAGNQWQVGKTIPIFVKRNDPNGNCTYSAGACLLDPWDDFRLYKCKKNYTKTRDPIMSPKDDTENWQSCLGGLGETCDPLDYCNCNINNPPFAEELSVDNFNSLFAGQCFTNEGKMYVLLVGTPQNPIAVADVMGLVNTGNTESIKQIDDDCFDCPKNCDTQNFYHKYTDAEQTPQNLKKWEAGDIVKAPDATGKFYLWVCLKNNPTAGSIIPKPPAQNPTFWKQCTPANGGPPEPCECPCEEVAFELCKAGAGDPHADPAVPPAGLFEDPWMYSPGECVYYPGPTPGKGELWYAAEYTNKQNHRPVRNPLAGQHTSRFKRCVTCEEVTTTTTTTTSGTTTCCPENLDVIFEFGAAYSKGACVVDPTSQGTDWPNPRGATYVYIAKNDIAAANAWPNSSTDWEKAECDGEFMDGELSGCDCADSKITADSYISWTNNGQSTGKPSINCVTCGFDGSPGTAGRVITKASYEALDVDPVRRPNGLGFIKRGECITIITQIGGLIYYDANTRAGKAKIGRFQVYKAVRDFPDGTTGAQAPIPGKGVVSNGWWRQMGPTNLSTVLPDSGINGYECEPPEATTTTTPDPCTTSIENWCNPSHYDPTNPDCQQYPVIFWKHPYDIENTEGPWCDCEDCKTDRQRGSACPEVNDPKKGPLGVDFKRQCSIKYGADARQGENIQQMADNRCFRNPYWAYKNGYPKGICVRYGNSLYVCIKGGQTTNGWNPAIAPVTDLGRVWKECTECRQSMPDPYP